MNRSSSWSWGSRPLVFILSLITTLIYSGILHADPRPPVVAVFEIRDTEGLLQEAERDNLTRYLSTRLAEGGKLKLVPQAELRKILETKKAESYRACYDESCQVEIGRELAAEKSISTEIIKLGDACAVSITVYDLASAATEEAATERGKCGMNAFVALIDAAVVRLIQGPENSESKARLPALGYSPARLRFATQEKQVFHVEFLGHDGNVLRCSEAVTETTACEIRKPPVGMGRYKVRGNSLNSYQDDYEIERANVTITLDIETIASPGNVIPWTFGGISLTAGIALSSVGFGVDSSGLKTAGILSALGGAGLIALGFLFDRSIDVDVEVLDAN